MKCIRVYVVEVIAEHFLNVSRAHEIIIISIYYIDLLGFLAFPRGPAEVWLRGRWNELALFGGLLFLNKRMRWKEERWKGVLPLWS